MHLLSLLRTKYTVDGQHTWASITKTRAPQWPNNTSESNAGSKKSICPGKSQIYQKREYGQIAISTVM